MRIILVAFLFTITSCTKEYSCEKCTGTDFTNATIVFTGEPALDGCGWLIKIGSDFYHPDVLDATFMQDQLPVKIIFEALPGKYVCGLLPLEYADIHIKNIVK